MARGAAQCGYVRRSRAPARSCTRSAVWREESSRLADAVNHLSSVPGLGAARSTDGINSTALQRGGAREGTRLALGKRDEQVSGWRCFRFSLGLVSVCPVRNRRRHGRRKLHTASGGCGPPGLPTYLPPSGNPEQRNGDSGLGNFSNHSAPLGSSGYAPQQDSMKQMNNSGTGQVR
jgi:hypothetical protein